MAENKEEQYQKIMCQIGSLMREHKRAVDAHVGDTNLHKSQHRLLLSLAKLGKNISQKSLAEDLNVTPAAVAVTLKKLQNNGFVKKQTREADNRFNEVAMTEKGRRIVKESQKVFRGIEDKIFDSFTAEELDLLQDFVTRMRDNLHQDGKEAE